MSTCARCTKPIEGTTTDPIVSSTSLGAGYYHYTCFRAAWNEKNAGEMKAREASRARRSEAMKVRWKEGKMR